VERAGTGTVAVDAIGAGEVVTEARVGGPGAAGLAGRLPPGTRAVLVPLEVPGLPVRVGDRVDLLGVASPTAPVARGATVVALRPDALVVAVRPTDAVALAAALGQGPLVPALVSATG
jgi:Flp pilus assembly protein CpaB